MVWEGKAWSASEGQSERDMPDTNVKSLVSSTFPLENFLAGSKGPSAPRAV